MTSFVQLPPARALSTARLTLRPPEAADLGAYTAYCAGDRSRFVGGPFAAPSAFEKFAAMIGHWAIRDFGRYIMVLEGRPIGHVGPLLHDDTLPPDFTWTLWDGSVEGSGYVTEAALAVARHLFHDCGWSDMIIRVQPDNIRSRRIAERLNATLSDDPAPSWYPGALTYHLKELAP